MTTLSKEDITTIVREAVAQAVAQAGQVAAQQSASQVAQQIGETVSQTIQKALQTTGIAGTTFEKEIAETGMGERAQLDNADRSGFLFLNTKQSFDDYAAHLARVRTIAEQSLQNAVETANMVGKQAVRHSDISCDKTWNKEEK